MKKLILTFFACIMMVGLFAQKSTIQNFVDGKISKDAFVEQIVNHFDKYDITAEQEVKIQKLASNKAENYLTIAKLKTTDPELYKKKMKGQKSHLRGSLRFILDESQFRAFMIDSRVEMADRKNQTKDKK